MAYDQDIMTKLRKTNGILKNFNMTISLDETFYY